MIDKKSIDKYFYIITKDKRNHRGSNLVACMKQKRNAVISYMIQRMNVVHFKLGCFQDQTEKLASIAEWKSYLYHRYQI
jgi:hypothetical protein